MNNFIESIKNCPLFFGISDQDVLHMLKCLDAKIIKYEKKQTVISEGDIAKTICIVLSGSVQMFQIDYYGNRSIISNAEKYSVFAEEFSCAGNMTVPVSIVASEPSVIMHIESNRVLHTCANYCSFHQQLIFNLMKDLAEKNVLFHQKLEIISKRTTRDKLMTYLMLQSKNSGKKCFEIPFNRQELADYLEVDRSGLSAEISKMRKEGILESNKNYFKLL